MAYFRCATGCTTLFTAEAWRRRFRRLSPSFTSQSRPSVAIYIAIYNVLAAGGTRVASPPAFAVGVLNSLGPILRCGSGGPGLSGQRPGPRLTLFSSPATCSFSNITFPSRRVTTFFIYIPMPWSWVRLYISVLGEVVLPGGGLQAFFFQRFRFPLVLFFSEAGPGKHVNQTFLVGCPASPHHLAICLHGSLHVVVVFPQ